MFSRIFATYYILDLMVRKAVPRLVTGAQECTLRRLVALIGRGISPNIFSGMCCLIIVPVARNFELSSKDAFERS
jgi:hypothetical protein